MASKPVAIIMGSQSDWATMKHAARTLDALKIGHVARIVSAHRTPRRLYEFAGSARKSGFKVIIAGAGGAAHLPGMTASMTPLPVFGVPIKTRALAGKDSLLSIMQMPGGIPVGTLAIGKAGAINAALLAASVLALSDGRLAKRLGQGACKAAQRGFQPEARATLGHREERRVVRLAGKMPAERVVEERPCALNRGLAACRDLHRAVGSRTARNRHGTAEQTPLHVA